MSFDNKIYATHGALIDKLAFQPLKATSTKGHTTLMKP